MIHTRRTRDRTRKFTQTCSNDPVEKAHGQELVDDTRCAPIVTGNDDATAQCSPSVSSADTHRADAEEGELAIELLDVA
jgi:hypothetical protein